MELLKENTSRKVDSLGRVSIPKSMRDRLDINEGDEVEEKQPIAVIEAMKMETNILATQKGVIDKIYISEGQQVKAGGISGFPLSLLSFANGSDTVGFFSVHVNSFPSAYIKMIPFPMTFFT